MESLLADYRDLQTTVDAWFARSLELAGAEIHCVKGCSRCCRGLFDITLLDACNLKNGFDRLDPDVKEEVLAKAQGRLKSLQAEWPDFAYPYILNELPEELWTEMPEEDETPCPLLSEAGACLLYQYRPMTCRLHGLPLVDLSGEIFDERWCSLNFVGTDPLQRKELRWEFRRLFSRELDLFRAFTDRLLGEPSSELDTFIPTALLIDFDGAAWKKRSSKC